MQKCPTAQGSCPRARRAWASPPKLPGRGLGEGRGGLAWPQPLGLGEGPLEQPALAGVAQILQGQDMDIGHGAGEGGMDDDASRCRETISSGGYSRAGV